MTERNRTRTPLPGSTPAEKLALNHVVDPESGCWRWTGAHIPSGYGQLKAFGRVMAVHRIAYALHFGPIPDGMEIDHVRAAGCIRRDCINPDHLEAVTRAENMARTRGYARARLIRRRWEHGGITGYKHGCRCDPCKQAKADINRRRKSRLNQPVRRPSMTPQGRSGCGGQQVGESVAPLDDEWSSIYVDAATAFNTPSGLVRLPASVVMRLVTQVRQAQAQSGSSSSRGQS